MDSIKKIKQFYDSETLKEWERMDRHPLEFGVTKRYMEEYYLPNSSILDVGGGPGKYSFYLSKMGHEVTLVDLSKKNIEFAVKKAKELKVNIKAIAANAIDLSSTISGTYDVVQCMGPIYHLIKESDRISVVNQCLSLLKSGGLFVASFISSYAFLNDMIANYPQEVSKFKKYFVKLDEDYRNIESIENPGFTDAYFTYPKNISPFFENFNLETLVIAGVEGLPVLNEKTIKELPSNLVDEWINIAYNLSKDKLTWGASQHFLYIGRKV